MAGNETARILHAEVAFQPAFKQIPRLARDIRSVRPAPPTAMAGFIPAYIGRNRAHRHRGKQSADRARTGLAGRNPRRKFRSADRAPGNVGADIARPDDQQQRDHICPTGVRALPAARPGRRRRGRGTARRTAPARSAPARRARSDGGGEMPQPGSRSPARTACPADGNDGDGKRGEDGQRDGRQIATGTATSHSWARATETNRTSAANQTPPAQMHAERHRGKDRRREDAKAKIRPPAGRRRSRHLRLHLRDPGPARYGPQFSAGTVCLTPIRIAMARAVTKPRRRGAAQPYRAPKRRSRRAYSARAALKWAASKSGQSTSRNTSSA